MSEARYIELECSFVYSKAVFEVLKEDGFDTSNLWNSKQEAEEVSE